MLKSVKTKAEVQAEIKDVPVAVEDAQMATSNHVVNDVLEVILNLQEEEVQMLQDRDAQEIVQAQTDVTDAPG